MELSVVSSKLTSQLTQLRNEVRSLHESTLLELQISAAAKIDRELNQRVLSFTKAIDSKKEKAALFVLQLFNDKAVDVGSQSRSQIMNCLQFSTDGCAEPEEHSVLADDAKLGEMAASFLDIVNEFYCHRVDSFVLNPRSKQNSQLVADENSKGQLFWSQRMVEAAAEWGEQGARLQGLYSEGGFKAQAHEQNILTYVDDQLEVAFTLMCVELKADVLALVARARVESLRIKEAAMYDFQQTMKRIKSIVNDIDSHAGSDVAAMRTSSFVLSQAMQQERAFASTMAEASELFVSNVGMAARICVMREIEGRNYSNGSLKRLLVSLLGDISAATDTWRD